MAHFHSDYPPTEEDKLTLVTLDDEVESFLSDIGFSNVNPDFGDEDNPSYYYGHLLVLLIDGEIEELYAGENVVPWVWLSYDCLRYSGQNVY